MKILNPQRQKGMALIMVLLFLVLLTGVSVWGVRKSILSEGMARNQLDKEAAREAAETALRDAERDIFNPTPNVANNASCSRGDWQITSNDFTADCRKGLCLMADSLYTTVDWSKAVGGEVWWPSSKGGLWNNVFSEKPQRVPSTAANCDFTGGVPLGSFTGAAALKGVARQPEYIVEYFRRKNVRINLNETQVSSQGQKANQWSAMYRITARGFGYSANTQVVLQTVFFP
ncbi:pilus assembly protein [Comamonas sp. wu1-DMT]|uniref:pilus assembly PilX family protein n=1 Tax=Comamonas sp. wu1-DMT TaxID=3126390 RepID=UPI0032E463DC